MLFSTIFCIRIEMLKILFRKREYDHLIIAVASGMRILTVGYEHKIWFNFIRN